MVNLLEVPRAKHRGDPIQVSVINDSRWPLGDMLAQSGISPASCAAYHKIECPAFGMPDGGKSRQRAFKAAIQSLEDRTGATYL